MFLSSNNKVMGRLKLPNHASLMTADPGVASLIPAPSNTFVESDHEIISTAILLPSADSRRIFGSYAQSTGSLLSQACPGKRVVR